MDAEPTTPRAEAAAEGNMPGSSKDAEADSRFRTPPQKRAMSEAGDSDRGGKFQTIAAEEESVSIPPPELYSPTSPAKSEADVEIQVEDAAGAGPDQRQSDGMIDADIIEEISDTLITHIDCENNLNNIEKLKKKFGKLKPQTELIEMALEVTNGSGNQVSRAERPPPADEPGRGELQDEHRVQAIHEAKHQSNGVVQQQDKHKKYVRDDFWKTKFVTPHPNIIEWNNVYRRITNNRDTSELIEDARIDPKNAPKDYEYSLCSNPLEDMCFNIQTTFYYRESDPQKPDIVEVHSPPRISKEASKRGLKGGFALDPTVRRKRRRW